jgi:hypothetical protein
MSRVSDWLPAARHCHASGNVLLIKHADDCTNREATWSFRNA